MEKRTVGPNLKPEFTPRMRAGRESAHHGIRCDSADYFNNGAKRFPHACIYTNAYPVLTDKMTVSEGLRGAPLHRVPSRNESGTIADENERWKQPACGRNGGLLGERRRRVTFQVPV
ncbi:hypothetical protein ABTX80_06400 [Streptomyces erythrochromogenes]|uniref:hypothetical protein n=1 Tax=Streptomyces erythrochromogenes TaxID=285574 RepID=UPI003332B9F2